MTQSHDEMLARVRAMAAYYGYETWECALKDKEALRHVLALLDDVVHDLADCWDCTEALVLKQAAQSVAERQSGRDSNE